MMTLDDVRREIDSRNQRKAISVDHNEVIQLTAEISVLERRRDEIILFEN